MCQRKTVSVESAQKVSDALNRPIKELFDIFSIGNDTTRGFAPKTIKGYHNFLHNVFEFARKEGCIVKNPADNATPPNVKKKEAEFFEIEEILKIRETIEQEPFKYRVMLFLLIECGLRRGELCGIKWDVVDFDNKTILINNNIQWSKKDGLYEETPKFDEIRTLSISDDIMTILADYKSIENEFKANRSDNGAEYNPNHFLFHQDDGIKPIFPSSLNIWMKKNEKKYNLPHIYPHKFRHSQASILYANNIDVVTISNRLGHAQVSTTQNIYSHLLKNSDQKAWDAIANSIWQSKKS